MDAAAVIEVEKLTKEFRVSARAYGTLKAQALSTLKRLLFTRDRTHAADVKVALSEISFKIPAGQVVALVGRNGSGKSTLLSILSKIYLPTSGHISYRGRLASLLELGVGFDDELSGTENIFFACQVRGLSEAEVIRRYPDIIAFAELDELTMSLPVRTYSSGMQARLAFAAAIHVDADILLIDEALAVGDFMFQEKCLARISDFKDAGKTIIMVVHSQDMVKRFADRAIWLERGHLRMDGPPAEVLNAYEAAGNGQ